MIPTPASYALGYNSLPSTGISNVAGSPREQGLMTDMHWGTGRRAAKSYWGNWEAPEQDRREAASLGKRWEPSGGARPHLRASAVTVWSRSLKIWG